MPPFHATDSGLRGPVGVNPDHRGHFIWEGTRDQCFFNRTTAFWMMGWRDERDIGASLERLRRLKINRMKVLLSARTDTIYGEGYLPCVAALPPGNTSWRRLMRSSPRPYRPGAAWPYAAVS